MTHSSTAHTPALITVLTLQHSHGTLKHSSTGAVMTRHGFVGISLIQSVVFRADWWIGGAGERLTLHAMVAGDARSAMNIVKAYVGSGGC